MNQDKQTFSQHFCVEQSECDFRNQMMPAAFFRRAQQAAIEHSNAAGLTDEVYQKTHTAFLLAKATLQIIQPVHVGQALTLQTIPSVGKRAVYNRLTVFCDEQGREVAVHDSRWILVDMQSRRILRAAPEEMEFPFVAPTQRELEIAVKREEIVKTSGFTAGYSLCDCNQHMNNTRYADLVCDLIPFSMLKDHLIERITLHYHSEIPIGTDFSAGSGEWKDKTCYFLFEQEGKRCAEAQVELKPVEK